ncbi:MAG: hypothetical protein V4662_24335 [Verrucomicrobiota bacterium]
MAETSPERENLILRIKEKRAQITTYLACTEPRANRLTTASIVCGAIASLLTAGPAVGGASFTKSLTAALGTSPESSPSWRILCAAATLLSVIATTAVAIHRNENLAVRVSKAQACSSKLEGLETQLALGSVTAKKAAEAFELHLLEVGFVR